MDDFPLSQETYRVTDIRVVSHAENIVVSCTGFLFSRHILVKVGYNVAFALEVSRRERHTRRSLRIYAGCVVDEIGVKTAFLDFVNGEVSGKLVDNR